ncbi:undecaprenyl/decaprenyl-phosphate alpha-N-acetylglucosaminyl 1-phosphate transferase [candidate division KSB1 bacterium]|nr:undecaprenyl/decaprenyl-phosphate alpha-N-acetylglucosaminyl 1-phosphate transferase [candidate division KSB1 bacterium]
MGLLFFVSLVAFIISVSLTPVLRALAMRHDITAKPNHRTIHRKPIPLLGGISIFIAFVAGIVLVMTFGSNIYSKLVHENFAFVSGGLVILLLGIYDDIRGANAYQKFLAQIVAAVLVVALGYQIRTIILPFGAPIHLGWLSIPLTILWLVMMSNAFNLIDGLDGLASGVALGVSLTMMTISLWNGNLISAVPAGILAGALAGFLIFNFNPARIFLGDSGSLVIGFWLACFSINGTFRTSSAIAILVPIIIFSLPILDTSIAFLRRISKGMHPFKADKKHLHHRLLYLGLSQRQAMLILTGVSCFWGMMAFFIVALDNRYSLLIATFVLFTIYFGIRSLIPGKLFVIRSSKTNS